MFMKTNRLSKKATMLLKAQEITAFDAESGLSSSYLRTPINGQEGGPELSISRRVPLRFLEWDSRPVHCHAMRKGRRVIVSEQNNSALHCFPLPLGASAHCIPPLFLPIGIGGLSVAATARRKLRSALRA